MTADKRGIATVDGMNGGKEEFCGDITGPSLFVAVTRAELRFDQLEFARQLCDHIQHRARRRPVALRPTLSDGLPLSGFPYEG